MFVSNHRVENLVRSACRNEPDLILRMSHLPDMKIEKVPMGKDAADKLIEKRIESNDVVLTDDTALTVKCLNKGALVIDYRGRIFGRPLGGSWVGKNDVRDMKVASRTGRKKKDWARAFRKSLQQAIGCG